MVREATEADEMRMNSVRLVRRLALIDRKWSRDNGGDGDAPAFDMETLRALQKQFADTDETGCVFMEYRSVKLHRVFQEYDFDF